MEWFHIDASSTSRQAVNRQLRIGPSRLVGELFSEPVGCHEGVCRGFAGKFDLHEAQAREQARELVELCGEASEGDLEAGLLDALAGCHGPQGLELIDGEINLDLLADLARAALEGQPEPAALIPQPNHALCIGGEVALSEGGPIGHVAWSGLDPPLALDLQAHVNSRRVRLGVEGRRQCAIVGDEV